MDKEMVLKDTALWQTIQGEVELTISRGSYLTWFKNTRVLRQEGNVLTIGVPNIFTKTQLEARYKPMLDEMLEKNNDHKAAARLRQASTHWLRHTHGAHAVARGVPIEVLQVNLGHASINTTTIYTTSENKRRLKTMHRLWQNELR